MCTISRELFWPFYSYSYLLRILWFSLLFLTWRFRNFLIRLSFIDSILGVFLTLFLFLILTLNSLSFWSLISTSFSFLLSFAHDSTWLSFFLIHIIFIQLSLRFSTCVIPSKRVYKQFVFLSASFVIWFLKRTVYIG